MVPILILISNHTTANSQQLEVELDWGVGWDGLEMGWEWGQKWDGNGLGMDYEWIG